MNLAAWIPDIPDRVLFYARHALMAGHAFVAGMALTFAAADWVGAGGALAFMGVWNLGLACWEGVLIHRPRRRREATE